MTTMAAPTYATTAASPAYTNRAAASTYSTMAASPTYNTMASAPTYATAVAAPYTTGFAGNTTMAAPTSTYASPANYGTTTMAAPVSYAAPAAQYASYTAPAAQYGQSFQPAFTQNAQPAMTTRAPSYVAAPTMMAAPTLMTQASQAVIALPSNLTDGLPTPQQIAVQKAGYAAALEKQLVEATSTIRQETEIEKTMAKFNTEKQIAMFTLQAEEQLVVQLGLLDEQSQIQQLELKKALVERNLQLSSQASNLTLEYEMKALQTELAAKQYQFQQKYMTAENKLEQDYAAQVALANTGTAYAAPAGVIR